MAQGSSALGQRCAGRFAVNRIPYPVDQALAVLKDVSKLVLVCAKHPVAFFAYPDKPSLLTPADCHVLPLATLEQDMLDALERLADALGEKTAEPKLQKLARPDLPTGALNPAIGRAHVRPPVTNATLVCRLLLENTQHQRT